MKYDVYLLNTVLAIEPIRVTDENGKTLVLVFVVFAALLNLGNMVGKRYPCYAYTAI